MQGTHGATPDGGDARTSRDRTEAARSALGATLAVRVEVDGERAVLGLIGEFDLSNLEAAQVGLRRALDESPSGRVVIDMRELIFIDSTGIAFLVHTVKEHGPKITVRRSEAPAVRRVVGLVGADRLFALEG
jgi:anti-anti-sigma factor